MKRLDLQNTDMKHCHPTLGIFSPKSTPRGNPMMGNRCVASNIHISLILGALCEIYMKMDIVYINEKI